MEMRSKGVILSLLLLFSCTTEFADPPNSDVDTEESDTGFESKSDATEAEFGVESDITTDVEAESDVGVESDTDVEVESSFDVEMEVETDTESEEVEPEIDDADFEVDSDAEIEPDADTPEAEMETESDMEPEMEAEEELPVDPYNGCYTIEPTVTQRCGFGRVNYNISQICFEIVGSTLEATAGPTYHWTNNIFIQDPAPAGNDFSVGKVVLDSCEEHYTVAGSFTTPTTFEGTWTTDFVDFDDYSCAVAGCSDLSVNITGTRE